MWESITTLLREIAQAVRIANRYTETVDLLNGGTQGLTATWTNLGDYVDVKRDLEAALWLKITVGTSTAIQFRVLGKYDIQSANEFEMPIELKTSSAVLVNPEYFELTGSGNQSIVVSFNTSKLVPYVKIQVKDAAAGSGSITVAQLTKS